MAGSTLPVFIIAGSADVVISPQQSETMHCAAKNSKLVTIAGAGHSPSLEKPAEWNATVTEFVSHITVE